MILIKKKPVTPGQRHLILINKKNLSKNEKRLKNLTKGLNKKGGRNNSGRITVRHQGGGHKRIYRKLDFDYKFKNKIIKSLEYDPNRSGYIHKIYIPDEDIYAYMLAPDHLQKESIIGEIQNHAEDFSTKIGFSSLLKYIPIGMPIHNIEFAPGRGGACVRSAGTYATILQKDDKYSLIQLPSGEKRFFLNICKCTVGTVSNIHFKEQVLGKAGRNRWLNKRPHVRGVAMNPIDHPHGGGEGKTAGGRPSVTPWGIITKGKPTRKRKNSLILQRRK